MHWTVKSHPHHLRDTARVVAVRLVDLRLQHRLQSVRFARHLRFPNDLARVIHNADAGLLDRNVQSSKMVHAALLLLMLEAVTTDLVSIIGLKRSTPNLQLSTRTPADYPIFDPKATVGNQNVI